MAAPYPRRRSGAHGGCEPRADLHPRRVRRPRSAARARPRAERDDVQRQRTDRVGAGAQGARPRPRTAGDGAGLRNRLHRGDAARLRERRSPGPGRRDLRVRDRAPGGRGAARARRRGHFTRHRRGRARPLRCGGRSEHARRHRPPGIGRRDRAPGSRLQAARSAHRAPRVRRAGGRRQAVHRGGVRGR